jgi:hypothetical protein
VSSGIPVALNDLTRWTRVDGHSTYEIPLLPSDAAAELFARLREGPRFDGGYKGRWSAFPIQGDFNETTHKRLFRHKDGVPVWKGRSFDQFDPHGDDPAGYAREPEAMSKLQAKRERSRVFRNAFPRKVLADRKTHPFYAPRVAFRDVSRATDSRTVRACLVPPSTFLTNSAPYLVFPEGGSLEQAFVLGVMNSLAFDWQARRFVETHLNFYVLNLLCFPPPEGTDMEAIALAAARLSCIDDRFVDFADACGVEVGELEGEDLDGVWAELDALVVRAYGLEEPDLGVVFSDFTDAAVPAEYRDQVRNEFHTLASL